MIFLNRSLLVALTIILFLSASCSLNRSSNDNPQLAANANSTSGNATDVSKSPNDDIEDLRANINVQFEPEEVSWRIVTNPKGGERLIAVFRLSAADAAAFAARSGAKGSHNSTDVGVENWFPPELKAMGETTGESTINGVSIPVNEFLRAPFNEGQAYVIPDSDYLIVELHRS